MNEDKATRYHRRRRAAQWMAGAAVFATLALLTGSGATRWLASAADQVSRAPGRAPWLSALMATVVFAAVLGLGLLAVRLPFDAFREWMLERSYGLERTSFGAWLGGYLRGVLVLAVLLVGAILVVRASAWAGAAWWALAAAGLWLSSVGWSLAAPLVLRAFGGLRPLDRPHVTERLHALRRRAGAHLEVYEWRGGSDSRRAHAALGGVGRTRRIILSDTLLETLTADEVEVVVAHELAHHVHGDVWTAALWRLAVLAMALGAAALVLARAAIGPGPADLTALPIIALVGQAVAWGLAPVGFALSRAHERRADAFAIDTTANLTAFLTSMRRLAASNLLEEHPSRLTRLLSSHPSIQERVAAAIARAERAATR